MNRDEEIAHNLDANIEDYTGVTHSDHNNNVLVQQSKEHLLDSCSTVDLISDGDLLDTNPTDCPSSKPQGNQKKSRLATTSSQ